MITDSDIEIREAAYVESLVEKAFKIHPNMSVISFNRENLGRLLKYVLRDARKMTLEKCS